MKNLMFALFSALMVAGTAIADSGLASALQDIRAYEQERIDFEKAEMSKKENVTEPLCRPVRPSLPDSFWSCLDDISGLSDREIEGVCCIVEFHASPRLREKAQRALKQIGTAAPRLDSRAGLRRHERVARCLHREFGDGSAFERTAVYKKILRKKLSLTGSGK